VPSHDVVFVGAQAGPVVDHTGRCPLVASASFAEVLSPDVVVVPGGKPIIFFSIMALVEPGGEVELAPDEVAPRPGNWTWGSGAIRATAGA
jgi:hypothetical protein